jgi:pimeloyl-ACP methyl ester carboxylesterase
VAAGRVFLARETIHLEFISKCFIPEEQKIKIFLKILRLLLGMIMIVLLCAMVAGHIRDRRAFARASSDFPRLGSLIDIGGYHIHLYCTGQGTQTVVLDSEFAGSVWEWRAIQPELSRNARVCSFDRPGLGWSDPSPLPRTAQNNARELHTALVNARIAAPYVIVGHSISGLDALVFNREFHNDVSAVVLVDSVHPDWVATSTTRGQMRIFGFINAIGSTGLLRFLGFCGKAPAAHGPRTCAQYVRANYLQVAEGPQSAAQAREAMQLGEKPLLVIARDSEFMMKSAVKPQQLEDERKWELWQHALAAISTNSQFIVAANCGHEIPLDQPQVVVKAIRGLLPRLSDNSQLMK